MYASGFNMIGRSIAKSVGRAISDNPNVTGKSVGGVTAVGDVLSPALLLLAACPSAYNTTIDLQCRADFLK